MQFWNVLSFVLIHISPTLFYLFCISFIVLIIKFHDKTLKRKQTVFFSKPIRYSWVKTKLREITKLLLCLSLYISLHFFGVLYRWLSCFSAQNYQLCRRTVKPNKQMSLGFCVHVVRSSGQMAVHIFAWWKFSKLNVLCHGTAYPIQKDRIPIFFFSKERNPNQVFHHIF